MTTINRCGTHTGGSQVGSRLPGGGNAWMCYGSSLAQIILGTSAQIAHAVGSTMGPRGHTVILSQPYGPATITKDGVKVAKEVKFSGKPKSAIASIIQSAANTTNQIAGDGTTTTVVLMHAALSQGFKRIVSGSDSMGVRRGIEKAIDKVVDYLKTISVKVENIAAVATVSANGDSRVGEVIAEVMKSVGRDGVITVDEGKSVRDIDYEVMSGMSFNQGYCSPFFATNQEKGIAELEKPLILLANHKISSAKSIYHILQKVAESGRSLLIIAEDVEGEALATMVYNKLRGTIKACAVKAPGYGTKRYEMLKDIQCLVGAKEVINPDASGMNLDKYVSASEKGCSPYDDNEAFSIVDLLGESKSAIITKDLVTIVGGAGDEGAVQERVAFLKREIEECTSDYDIEKLRERIAKLTGGVAVLKAGGSTDVEVKERKDRYEDALAATRAAVEEGIVPGGGVALYSARKILESFKLDDEDEQAGVDVVYQTLSAPIYQIAKNAGYVGAVVVQKLDEIADRNIIFDARTGEFCDYNKSEVVDPLKVVRIAFEDALRTAAVLLTTDTLLYEDSKKDDDAGIAGGGEMPGMDDMGF